MPCTDGGVPYPPHPKTTVTQSKMSDVEAMLCGVLRAIDTGGYKDFDKFLDTVDWKEIGVSRKYLKRWWHDHKAADSERREFEELRNSLTADQLKLLKKHL